MRRFVRILITALASLLLMLTCLLAPQSVRSYWKTDIVTRYMTRSTADGQCYYRLHMVSSDGQLSFNVDSEVTPGFLTKDAFDRGRIWEFSLNWPRYRGPGVVKDPAFLGFTYLGPKEFSHMHDGDYTFRVAAPWWALTAITSMIPVITLSRRWRQRRALTGGLCRICGYDLRATPDRCPECGTASQQAPKP